MTYAEAEERASLLWQNVGTVSRLRVTPELWEVTVTAVVQLRGLDSGAAVHYLDALGRPTCHPTCIAREASLGGAGAS
jgi:hypothetical protein